MASERLHPQQQQSPAAATSPPPPVAALAPDYPVRTARLDLRPFADGDLDDLLAYHALPEVVRYLYAAPLTRDEAKAALERKKAEGTLVEDGGCLCLAVVPRDVGRVIGEVLLFWRSRAHRQGELGYVFHPAFSGRGYATEAARAVLALGFDGLGLHRVFARCDARNAASWHLMERLGMRREAHLVQNEFIKGEWTDELVYALLRAEYAARQSGGRASELAR